MNARKYLLKSGAALLLLGLCFLSSVHTEAAVKKINVMGNLLWHCGPYECRLRRG